MKDCFKYTLMETIGVMLIIIVLLTLILPAVVKGREWGKSIGCRSNLKALGEAMFAYAGDNKGYGPTTGNYTVPWTYMLQRGNYINPDIRVNTWGYFTGAIVAKNVKINSKSGSIWDGQYPISNNILACPAEKIAYPYNPASVAAYGVSMNYRWNNGTHYGINRKIADVYWKATLARWASRTNLTKMPMLADGRTGDTDYYIISAGCSYADGAIARHWGRNKFTSVSGSYVFLGTSKVNVLMMDGHTRSATNEEVWRENLWLVGGTGTFGP